MHHAADHLTNAVPAFVTAGAAAIGAIGSRILGATNPLPAGLERLLDLGFAGIFIAALIYGLRIVWAAKLDADKKHDELEREIRTRLMAEIEQANKSRAEMIDLMRRKESRDTAP
ncbi:MAG: hypothetical protein RLZ97_1828 [Verrucomicrobiota bacterium]|jgi:type VI protein secretion system component VasK